MIGRAPSLALALPLLSAAAHAQANAHAQAAPHDARVDRLFAKYDTGASPGCAAGVLRVGTWVRRRGYGTASLDHAIPNGPAARR